MQHLILFENFNNEFADLFNQIKNVQFLPISKKQYKILEEEGWIEELEESGNNIDYDLIEYIELTIPEEDKLELINFNDDILEKYNDFDIQLKNKQIHPPFHIIDMIDYDKGKIFIFKVKDTEL
jgi:hypothetical protein